MVKIVITVAGLRDPGESIKHEVHIECAMDCDGSVCGEIGSDEYGQTVEADPHFHLVEGGRLPDASPRFHSVRF